MRRVRLFKIDLHERDERGVQTSRRVADGEGVFHTWGADYEEFESGPGNFTVAIVERPDGTVLSLPPHLIEFIDPIAP